MYIQSLIPETNGLSFDGKYYPVVNGIADVPKEVRDAVVSFTHWQDATDEISEDTLKALQPKEETPAKKKPVLKK